MPEDSPESDVDAFLEEAKSLPNDTCGSCRLPNVDEINRATLRFMRLRAEGKTTVPVLTFYRLHLVAKLNYTMGETSFRRHMRNCLGL